jgi:ankyrin repeat protein
VEKVRLLLDAGANPNAQSTFGNTALILAARRSGASTTVDLLLAKGADLTKTNVFGANALMAAAASGDRKTLESLLDHGAQINVLPAPSLDGTIWGGGKSPLMWSALLGYEDNAKYLIQRGAQVNLAGGMGSALSQAVWGGRTEMAKMLLDEGADINQRDHIISFTPVMWGVASDPCGADMLSLLISRGADLKAEGGESVDAYMGTVQTVPILAQKRGQAEISKALGLEKGDYQPAAIKTDCDRPGRIDPQAIRTAVQKAVKPLQDTARLSAAMFAKRSQNCNSCHQQYLPMFAVGLSRLKDVPTDTAAERELITTVLSRPEPYSSFEPVFHPGPAHTLGYALLGLAAEKAEPNSYTDAAVYQLCAIQGPQGEWHNYLPRPPIQGGDISATALAVHALKTYAVPARRAEAEERVQRAKHWLWNAKPNSVDDQAYQILGLAWAGETPETLQPLARNLAAAQRADGGWSQLEGRESDSYATGHVLYALRVGSRFGMTHPAMTRGVKFLLDTQAADGTWRVRRRAVPFQPTMDSGFPYGRDSWISATGTSWAVAALTEMLWEASGAEGDRADATR